MSAICAKRTAAHDVKRTVGIATADAAVGGKRISGFDYPTKVSLGLDRVRGTALRHGVRQAGARRHVV